MHTWIPNVKELKLYLFCCRPPFETLRFLGQGLVGTLFGFIMKLVVSQDLLGGYNTLDIPCIDIIVPPAVATGNHDKSKYLIKSFNFQ